VLQAPSLVKLLLAMTYFASLKKCSLRPVCSDPDLDRTAGCCWNRGHIAATTLQGQRMERLSGQRYCGATLSWRTRSILGYRHSHPSRICKFPAFLAISECEQSTQGLHKTYRILGRLSLLPKSCRYSSPILCGHGASREGFDSPSAVRCISSGLLNVSLIVLVVYPYLAKCVADIPSNSCEVRIGPWNNWRWRACCARGLASNTRGGCSPR
jgi:hypothetical protein